MVFTLPWSEPPPLLWFHFTELRFVCSYQKQKLSSIGTCLRDYLCQCAVGCSRWWSSGSHWRAGRGKIDCDCWRDLWSRRREHWWRKPGTLHLLDCWARSKQWSTSTWVLHKPLAAHLERTLRTFQHSQSVHINSNSLLQQNLINRFFKY